MAANNGPDIDEYMVRATVSTRHKIPFFGARVQAGFPSPATDYIERVCDLNDLCISNAEATYFVRVTGDSMKGDRIEPGDVLVVDCSQKASDGKIAVVWLNGEHTVKRIHHAHPMIVLMPSNHDYEPVYVQPEDDFRVFGVVTFVIQKIR